MCIDGHCVNVCFNRGSSRDVTRSRACLVTPLIRHFGGKLPRLCVPFVHYNILSRLLIQPAYGVVCLSVDVMKSMIFKHVYHEISHQHYN